MSETSTFIATLQDKERELDKQLEAVRATMKLFQNGHSIAESDSHKDGRTKEIPKNYEEAFTWNGKILFALSKIQKGFVTDIVDELLKYSKEFDRATLIKRVTGLSSALKTKEVLGAKKVGNKFKYFIR